MSCHPVSMLPLTLVSNCRMLCMIAENPFLQVRSYHTDGIDGHQRPISQELVRIELLEHLPVGNYVYEIHPWVRTRPGRFCRSAYEYAWVPIGALVHCDIHTCVLSLPYTPCGLSLVAFDCIHWIINFATSLRCKLDWDPSVESEHIQTPEFSITSPWEFFSVYSRVLVCFRNDLRSSTMTVLVSS